jgi:hypothetical protein
MSNTPTIPPKLLVIPIGGWGASQLGDIAERLGRIQGVVVAKLTGNDQYRDSHREVWEWMDRFKGVPIMFIGHSMGGNTARNEANEAIKDKRPVAGLVVLDCVQYFDDDHHSDCPNTKVFCAENSAPFIVSPIDGFPAEKVPGTTHNSLCHSETVEKACEQMAIAAVKGAT